MDYPQHTPRSRPWPEVAKHDNEMQRLQNAALDLPPGPEREELARQINEAYRKRQAAIRGTPL